MVGMGERTDCARWVLSLFLVTKKLYAKETEWSRGQIKTCRKKQHVKIDVKIGVANLMCGKSAVGGNYNSTHDTGARESDGGLLGYDPYEHDYYGIECYESFAEDEAQKKLKQMTKDNLVQAIRQCFKVYRAYIGLRNRYDSLKAAIDILRDQNTGYMQVVKEIERLYDEMSKQRDGYAENSKEWIEFERYTNALQQEAWIQ